MTRGTDLPDSLTPHKHTLCSLVSLPIFMSNKSEEQEEGISCRLIPARCRSCSLKANVISRDTSHCSQGSLWENNSLAFKRAVTGNKLDTFKPH